MAARCVVAQGGALGKEQILAVVDSHVDASAREEVEDACDSGSNQYASVGFKCDVRATCGG